MTTYKIDNMKCKFMEFPIKASTTGWLKTRNLGHNVSVVAYESLDTDNIVALVESSGSRVRSIKTKWFDDAEKYQEWVDSFGGLGHMLKEEFNVRTCLYQGH